MLTTQHVRTGFVRLNMHSGAIKPRTEIIDYIKKRFLQMRVTHFNKIINHMINSMPGYDPTMTLLQLFLIGIWEVETGWSVQQVYREMNRYLNDYSKDKHADDFLFDSIVVDIAGTPERLSAMTPSQMLVAIRYWVLEKAEDENYLIDIRNAGSAIFIISEYGRSLYDYVAHYPYVKMLARLEVEQATQQYIDRLNKIITKNKIK